MDDHLKILIVDDNPDDRALARREIDREFPNCQFRQAITAKELTQAVESTRFDLVVTDYQLRWGDGITVLLAVKVRWPGWTITFSNHPDTTPAWLPPCTWHWNGPNNGKPCTRRSGASKALLVTFRWAF